MNNFYKHIEIVNKKPAIGFQEWVAQAKFVWFQKNVLLRRDSSVFLEA